MTVSVPQLQVLAALAQAPKYVALIGDSLLASACGFLGGKPIVNLAVGGSKLRDILVGQVPQLGGLGTPAGIVFMGGTNDLGPLEAGTETWAQWTITLNKVIAGVLGAGISASKILACSPPPTQNETDFAYVQGMTAVYAVVCRPLGITVCNMIQLFTDGTMTFPPNPAYYYSDGVHGSTKAWEAIYNPIVGGAVKTW